MIDLEDVLDHVEKFLRLNLNTKIAQIESEKIQRGKGLEAGLPGVESGAFIRQLLDQDMIKYSPTIFFGIEDVVTVSNGPVSAESFQLFVEVLVTGMNNDGQDVVRLMRYSKAIKETMADAFDSYPYVSRLTVNQVRPINFRLSQDSSEEVRAGGVTIQGNLI